MKSKGIFEWAKRTLHISGAFKDVEKPDIERIFQPKTASHILKLLEAFPEQSIFGRSDVLEVIGIRPSRASDLLRELAECGMIEPVSGQWKGKVPILAVAGIDSGFIYVLVKLSLL